MTFSSFPDRYNDPEDSGLSGLNAFIDQETGLFENYGFFPIDGGDDGAAVYAVVCESKHYKTEVINDPLG